MRLTDWQLVAQETLGYYQPTETGPPPERYETPGVLAQRLNADIVQTPALELIDEFLMDVVDTEDGRGILNMPPQEGKTERVKALVLLVLRDNPNTRISIVSADAKLARKMGRGIKDMIATHASLGLRVRRDVAAQAEFQLMGARGGVYAVGVGGSLSGRPVDLMIIDDPIVSQDQAESEAHRERVWEWWQAVGSTRLSPGASVVLVQTRWHEDDLSGRLLSTAAHRWRHLTIPAQADHDPAKGQTDPMGREPGEYLTSARKRTSEQWATIRDEKGSRVWNALYQGRPAPTEGGIFKRTWWIKYELPQWIERDDGSRMVTHHDEILQSWDLAFKNTQTSDFVCGQVWMRRGVDCYLLDQVHARLDFVETCDAIRGLSARWPQAAGKIVEEAANGAAVLAALRHQVGGLIPEQPQGSKEARASAVSPLVEAGNVHLPSPDLAPWVTGFIEEAASFPNATHDDQVDAMSQGLNRLVLQPLIAGQILTAEDVVEDLADHAGYIPSFY